jgi:hypothetical protein
MYGTRLAAIVTLAGFAMSAPAPGLPRDTGPRLSRERQIAEELLHGQIESTAEPEYGVELRVAEVFSQAREREHRQIRLVSKALNRQPSRLAQPIDPRHQEGRNHLLLAARVDFRALSCQLSLQRELPFA